MILFVLSSLYACLIILSPIFSAKIVHIGAWSFLAWTPVNILTIAIIDTTNQQWGKVFARRTIVVSLCIRAFLFLGIFPILFMLPNAGSYDIQPLLYQSFRNFLVSESTTFVSRFWVQIPLFAYLERWPFIAKHAVSNTVFLICKGASKIFLMYFGVAGVNLLALMIGDIAAKLGSLAIGAPFAALVNRSVAILKRKRPDLTQAV